MQKLMQILPVVIAALLILLFSYTAINKLMSQRGFEIALAHSPLLKNVSILVSWMIPVIEIIIVIALFFPATRRFGLLASLVLMILFTGYIGYMIWFTPKLPCSCGGVLKHMTWREHLVFNICFTALAATGYLFEKNKRAIAKKQG